MTSRYRHISVLVPTLNEAENIDPLIERILSAVNNTDFYTEIIFVDGGSTDGTQDKINAWAQKADVRLYQSDGKGGLSGDIIKGAQESKSDVVVVMDADLSHPPEAIPSLVKPILDNTCDMVIGSRYIPEGKITGWPIHRRIISKIATLMAIPLVTVRDPMSGFFAVLREHIIGIGREATGFKIGLEMLARGDGKIKVIEVPIHFTDRRKGSSKMSSRQVAACLKQMLALAGGSVSAGNAMRFAVVGLMGFFVDYIIFFILLGLGANLIASHVTSFICATIFNYLFNAKWSFASAFKASGKNLWQIYGRYLLICILALFQRGAILGLLTEGLGWSPYISIVFAIGAASVINFVGTAFFVFPQMIAQTMPRVRWRVFALSVFGYILLLKLFFAGIIDLIPEEAYYWEYSRHLAFGYLDHPPMVAWLIWLGTTLFGNNEFGVRFPSLILWCITTIFMFKLSKNLFGKTAAFINLMFLATLPIYFSVGFVMLPDAPLYAAWAGCLYYYERIFFGRSRLGWLGVGICLGLGLISKYNMALLIPAGIVFALIDRQSRFWFKRPAPYMAVLLAILIFSPVIFWNAMNNWASFAFQSVGRWSGRFEFSLHSLLGSIMILLTPIGLLAALYVMLPMSKLKVIAVAENGFQRKRIFSIIFCLIPLSVFFIYSLQHAPRLHWTGSVWLAVLPLIAYFIQSLTKTGVSGLVAKMGLGWWKPTVAVMMLIYGWVFYGVFTAMPFLPKMKEMELPVAWKQMCKEIERLSAQVEQNTGKKPVVVGMDRYFITAEYAFYNNKTGNENNIAGRHLLGWKSLMFSQWYMPDYAIGKPFLLVDFTQHRLLRSGPLEHFESYSPILYKGIIKNGRQVGRFYYRVAYGYNR